MKRLIILRHGYTFEINENPRRIGAKTDLPLVQRGKEKIAKIAEFLQQYKIDEIISPDLKRTFESAEIVKKTIGFSKEILIDNRFKEIDYGPDENKLEEEVTNRIGESALKDWETGNKLPSGWVINIELVKNSWRELINNISLNQTILVVTSAGIARFALDIIDDRKKYDPKINPGHISIFEYQNQWSLKYWNYFL